MASCVSVRKAWLRSRSFMALLPLLCFVEASIAKSFEPMLLSSLGSPQLLTKTEGDLNILVLGDWGRKGHFKQKKVAKQMGIYCDEVKVDAVLSTGDNFYKDGLSGPQDIAFQKSYSNIYTAPSLQNLTWHVVLGNHDYHSNASSQFDPALKKLDERWHCERSFSLIYQLGPYENSSSVQFFFIDTTPLVDEYWQSTKQQYDWTGIMKPNTTRDDYMKDYMQDLSTTLNASQALWKIVVGHHPIRSLGYHGNTVELIQKVYPILKQHGVQFYINGHDHCLQHISDEDSGMQFLTSGGGSRAFKLGHNIPTPGQDGLKFYYDGHGFMAMSISPLHINVTFVDEHGNTLYSYNQGSS